MNSQNSPEEGSQNASLPSPGSDAVSVEATIAGGEREYPGEPPPLGLLPLTPEYQEADHGVYFREIQHALGNSSVRNIALSGNYGVGKSSILKRIVQQAPGKVVEISLSALSPEAPGLDPADASNSVTNRIQREIVKQLLYREDPRKTPASRFNRIEHFDTSWEVAAACLIAVAVSVVFVIMGWSGKLADALSWSGSSQWAHVNVFAATAVLAFSLRLLTYGRLTVKQLSAGQATVTLDKHNPTYFDQYLDEIFYFFDVSGRNIVVFEDIDRFDDTHIFETLRALNTLLNARRNSPVRFIYAMKDSIFEKLGADAEAELVKATHSTVGANSDKDPPAEQKPPTHWRQEVSGLIGLDDDDAAESHLESSRANRTKFFDLVIPVVPFITHYNAKNVAIRLFGASDFKISHELIDLVSRYVPDMRLLKNVRNEFILFRERIRSGDGKRLLTSDSELFAMMLYKSTHLSDFEAIRLGASRLDALYRVGRRLSGDGLRSVAIESANLSERLSTIDGIEQRSKVLGTKLSVFVQQVAKASGDAFDRILLLRGGSSVSDEDVQSASFWRDFIEATDDTLIQAQLYFRQGHVATLSFQREDLKAAIGPFSKDEWDKSDRDAIVASLSALRDIAAFLRRADIHELMARRDLWPRLGVGDLRELARKVLPSRLAFELVRAGHINRNFALCTAIFHGTRTTSAAMNFVVHHFQRAEADINFQLEEEDANAVILEVGVGSLADSALYNIRLLDYLLRDKARASLAKVMIESVAEGGENQLAFVKAYVSGGEFSGELIRQLAPLTPNVLTWLVALDPITETLQRELVGIALVSLKTDVDYKTDLPVRQYLAENYSKLPDLLSDKVQIKDVAAKVAWVFAKAQLKPVDLTPLPRVLVQELASRNLYVISRDNLAHINDGDLDIALDVLFNKRIYVYNYLVANLPVYVQLLESKERSIRSVERFTQILHDVRQRPLPLIARLVEHSSAECVVDDLSNAPPAVYPVLAAQRRFPASLGNVIAYLDHYGKVDEALAAVLKRERCIRVDGDSESKQKSEVAMAVLQAKATLAPKLRVLIVRKLDVVFAAEDVPVEDGDLFPLLIKNKIIKDEAATYEHLRGSSWGTRERVISVSSGFVQYMSPALVGPDLAKLMASALIDVTVKHAVMENSVMYAEGVDLPTMVEIARYAATDGWQLPLELIIKFAQAGVSPALMVRLLGDHLDSIADDQLKAILVGMRDPYRKLSKLGRDNPSVPDDPAHVALLTHLKIRGIVSTWSQKKGRLIVFKKRR
ncbi:hypothetical protein [Stenotrophomonas geniculata]|uniref:YobI family P-loop NTPase n=1 Tax=Stenotrophomonas geniculata TaxID=86188 RepID=UPI0039C61C3F